MTSGIPDYTDDEARRRLMRQGEDRLSGSTPAPGRPASDWPTQPLPPAPEPMSVPQPAPSLIPASSALPGWPPPARSVVPPPGPGHARRGQTLSWVALALALAASTSLGAGLFGALDTVEIDLDHPIARASHWASLAVVGLLTVLVALVCSVVALFVARPKMVATLALVLTLVGPWVGAIVGVKFGADSFAGHVGGLISDLIALVRGLFR